MGLGKSEAPAAFSTGGVERPAEGAAVLVEADGEEVAGLSVFL